MLKLKQVNSTTIKIDGKTYKGYTVGDLPKRFCIHLQ